LANLFKQSRRKSASSSSVKKGANANAQVAGLRFAKKSSVATKRTDIADEKGQQSKTNEKIVSVSIDVLDWMGQGVSRGNPTYFVQGALPKEQCDVEILSVKKTVAQATTVKVVVPSEHRVEPFCPVFEQCGGCQLQHIEPQAALLQRDTALCEMMERQLSMSASAWQKPLSGKRPQYRRKARLAIDARNVDNVKLGFREAGSNKVVNVSTCPILTPTLTALPGLLQTCISGFDSAKYIGHISLMETDSNESTNTAWVTIKHTKPLEASLLDTLITLAKEQCFSLSLENKRGAIRSLYDATQSQPLRDTASSAKIYTVDGFWLSPSANDFVQVNKAVNEQMIYQALSWLDVGSDERVADWFCGLGNFTLPLAKTGAHVQAVEGVAEMVQRAKVNASAQGIENVEWLHLDLADETNVEQSLAHGFDKVLLDPSREGALTVCHALVKAMPKAIVYVSCNPSTFARDAKVLLDGGYAIEKAGAVEMFPFTHHMEMMALFTAKPQ